MTTTERVARALKDLGETAEEIRNNLSRMGIKGVSRSAHCCPVARYLNSKGFQDAAAATSCSVSLPPGERAMFRRASVRTPEPIRLFMCNFDFGEYPELVE